MRKFVKLSGLVIGAVLLCASPALAQAGASSGASSGVSSGATANPNAAEMERQAHADVAAASHVTRLGARVDPVSQSIKVIGETTAQAPDLMAGMSGQVLMTHRSNIPSCAVRRRGARVA